jgi:WbqC-like protein family
MTLGIMQPYLFPYLGYFQLVSTVDKFVIYDDVSYIKQGWINRNQVLLHGRPHLFSVPLSRASSNVDIRNTSVCLSEYPRWRDKFHKTIALAYSAAPRYEAVRLLLASVVDTIPTTIGELAGRSVLAVCEFVGIRTRIELTSTVYGNSHLHSQNRVLDICARENADRYVNPSGGHELYSRDAFGTRGIDLKFLRSRPTPYQQFYPPFVPGLSIIDILMFNSPDQVHGLLADYDLVD